MAIEIMSFRSFEKNTLLGFFTIRLTSVDLEIRDCTLHQKGNQRWVSLPSRPYTKEDGTQGWAYIVDFYEKDTRRKFQETTLDALDKFMVKTQREPGGEAAHDIPF